jgi:hypothetical protein
MKQTKSTIEVNLHSLEGSQSASELASTISLTPSLGQSVQPAERGAESFNKPQITVKQFLDGNVNLSAWLVVTTSLAVYALTFTDRLFGLMVATGAISFAFIVALELWDQLYEKVSCPKRMAALRRLVAISPLFVLAYWHLRYRSITHDILYGEMGVGFMLLLGWLQAKKRLDKQLNGRAKNDRMRGLLQGLAIVASSAIFVPLAYGLNLLLDRAEAYSYWTGLVLTVIYAMFCLHLIVSLLIEKLVPHINKIHGK